jgi:putative DNA primase/helicase
MPEGIVNRAADNWRPLLTIADVAGGEWPERARTAAEASRNAEGDDSSRLEILLADIRDVFADEAEMPSADLVKALIELEGRPWAEIGNSHKPLTQNRLARMLKPLGITPENIRVGEKVLKGYGFARFDEAFSRYLGASEPLHRYKADGICTSEPFQTATERPDVADRKCEKSNNDGHCSGVADEKRDDGAKACAQCHGTPDGAERLYYRVDGVEVWLHPQCERFYRADNGWGRASRTSCVPNVVAIDQPTIRRL